MSDVEYAKPHARSALDGAIIASTQLRNVAWGSVDHFFAGGTLKENPNGAW